MGMSVVFRLRLQGTGEKNRQRDQGEYQTATDNHGRVPPINSCFDARET